jgi:hypothetical protein
VPRVRWGGRGGAASELGHCCGGRWSGRDWGRGSRRVGFPVHEHLTCSSPSCRRWYLPEKTQRCIWWEMGIMERQAKFYFTTPRCCVPTIDK